MATSAWKGMPFRSNSAAILSFNLLDIHLAWLGKPFLDNSVNADAVLGVSIFARRRCGLGRFTQAYNQQYTKCCRGIRALQGRPSQDSSTASFRVSSQFLTVSGK